MLLETGLIRYREVAEHAQADRESGALGGRRSEAMDREILLTGIGGQGVQLAAKTLALAGMLAGR
jgi:hypothetical protein